MSSFVLKKLDQSLKFLSVCFRYGTVGSSGNLQIVWVSAKCGYVVGWLQGLRSLPSGSLSSFAAFLLIAAHLPFSIG